jgi:hypothetical protein
MFMPSMRGAHAETHNNAGFHAVSVAGQQHRQKQPSCTRHRHSAPVLKDCRCVLNMMVGTPEPRVCLGGGIGLVDTCNRWKQAHKVRGWTESSVCHRCVLYFLNVSSGRCQVDNPPVQGVTEISTFLHTAVPTGKHSHNATLCLATPCRCL